MSDTANVVDNPDTETIRAFNDLVVADLRVTQVMLPMADGLTLITPTSNPH